MRHSPTLQMHVFTVEKRSKIIVEKDHRSYLKKIIVWLKRVIEKCCNFYPNNFKFSAVKKNYKYENMEMLQLKTLKYIYTTAISRTVHLVST